MNNMIGETFYICKNESKEKVGMINSYSLGLSARVQWFYLVSISKMKQCNA